MPGPEGRDDGYQCGLSWGRCLNKELTTIETSSRFTAASQLTAIWLKRATLFSVFEHATCIVTFWFFALYKYTYLFNFPVSVIIFFARDANLLYMGLINVDNGGAWLIFKVIIIVKIFNDSSINQLTTATKHMRDILYMHNIKIKNLSTNKVNPTQ